MLVWVRVYGPVGAAAALAWDRVESSMWGDRTEVGIVRRLGHVTGVLGGREIEIAGTRNHESRVLYEKDG